MPPYCCVAISQATLNRPPHSNIKNLSGFPNISPTINLLFIYFQKFRAHKSWNNFNLCCREFIIYCIMLLYGRIVAQWYKRSPATKIMQSIKRCRNNDRSKIVHGLFFSFKKYSFDQGFVFLFFRICIKNAFKDEFDFGSN